MPGPSLLNIPLVQALLNANHTDIISDCHLRNSGLITPFFYPQTDMESEEYVYS